MRVRWLLFVISFSFTRVCLSAEQLPTESSPTIYFQHLSYLESTGQTVGLLSQIMLDEKLQRLPGYTQQAELMKVRLYLEKGMHQSASAVLEKIISDPATALRIKNEARFYLAKSLYFQNSFAAALKEFNKVKEPVGAEVRAEWQHLLSLIYMRRGDYARAASYLRKNWWSQPDSWELYARFNLGVSLIRSGNHKQGMELIKQLGEKEFSDEEAKSIVDKANQTLGFLLLNRGHAEQARSYLEKVRLQGPYSNLALLGAGWASARMDQFRQAIVPWSELQKKDIRDISVQESILTLPYAYEQLGHNRKSAQLYQKAIKVFEAEKQQLETTIDLVERNQLVRALRKLDISSEDSWHDSIRKQSGESTLRYINQLINDNDFFNLLVSYREARILEQSAARKIEKVSSIQQQLLKKAGLGDRLRSRKNRDQIQFIEILAADLMKRSYEMQLSAQMTMHKIVGHIKQRALYLLQQRKQELDVYLVQSRLALAQNYEHLKLR